ncbi:hypothetical protein JOD57_003890 [Geodermatophilus bullaregiensis]|uniref:hypothetical protein n=1 Tax=Geodermatophilus bullaregiensis TaxID=1564160 RepID=UPI00195AE760|nr:hypothetical protein [Geodermatophilus bullaregiensis]MBM7808053.1 hypothetical protein [Geodermatophilus bullaregiensis]
MASYADPYLPADMGAERTVGADAGRGRTRVRRDGSVAGGLADGFSEASLAFSDELVGTSSCSDLVENLVAGFIRANGRFLDELGSTARRVADEVPDRRGRVGVLRGSELDRLADRVAFRLAARGVAGSRDDEEGLGPDDDIRRGGVRELDYNRLADLLALRLAARGVARPRDDEEGLGPDDDIRRGGVRELDYNRLADLLALRLAARGEARPRDDEEGLGPDDDIRRGGVRELDHERLADLVTERLQQRSQVEDQ